jgi:hypothetical protein
MEQVITRKTASIFNTCAMLKCTISLKGSLSLNLILINVNIDNCRVLLVFLREILPWLPHYSLALLANHHLVASTNVTSPTVRACSLSQLHNHKLLLGQASIAATTVMAATVINFLRQSQVSTFQHLSCQSLDKQLKTLK